MSAPDYDPARLRSSLIYGLDLPSEATNDDILRAVLEISRERNDLAEPSPGYAEWEQWWTSLPPDQRAEEIRAMDAHVAFWEGWRP